MYLKKIADLRIDSDLKQKDVALFLHVNRSTYSKWENGDNNIPLDKLDRLTMKYEVSFDYVFDNVKAKRIENCDYFKINLEILRHNIRLMRKRNGFTQDMLSRKIGVSKSTYSRYENGTLLIPIDKFSLLGNIFDISLDVLAGKVKLSKEVNSDKFMEVWITGLVIF